MFKACFLVLAIAASSVAQAAAEEGTPKSRLPSMTVTATATRDVVPDVAILRLSISAEKPTASAAAEETARSSQAVLAEIRSEGIDPRDLKTLVTVSPVFDEERGREGQALKRTLRGYVARNALTIRVRDTKRAGALARTLIDKGANVFEEIDFEVSENQHRMDELRVEATKDAVRRAKLYADAANVRLGRALDIEPDPDSGGQADMPRRGPPLSGVVSTVIPVEPGITRLAAKVSITWEILPKGQAPKL